MTFLAQKPTIVLFMLAPVAMVSLLEALYCSLKLQCLVRDFVRENITPHVLCDYLSIFTFVVVVVVGTVIIFCWPVALG